MSVEGIEFDPLKTFDFEGFGKLSRNFSELLGNLWGTLGELRDGKPVPYNVI